MPIHSSARVSRGLLMGLAFALSAAPALAGNPSAGRDKARACTVCHGPVGVSQAPNTPHLAGQPEAYLVTQLKAYRDGQRRHEVMSIIAKPLSEAEIADLAAWFASIEISATPPKQ